MLGALLFALICWGSIDGAVHAWTSGEFEGEGALRVPVWPARFVIVLGCALAASSYVLLSLQQFDAFCARRAARHLSSHALRDTPMFDAWQMFLIIAVLLGLVFSGVHIAVALGITSALGLYLMTGDIDVVRTFMANTAYEALRDYVFAVIPLFMLMGEFLAKCGAATDLFALVNRLTQRVPGPARASPPCSPTPSSPSSPGVSIAAAAAFSRIAWPEMKRHGYERKFALGCIAGSPASAC